MKWLKTYSILSDKRRKLKWSENALKDFRSVKLRNLVRFAYDNSPFYRKCYDQYGVRPDQIHTEEDIQKLPLLEKTSLQQTDPLQVITVKPKDGPLREVDLIDYRHFF